MSIEVHPSAIVMPGAEIGAGTRIGAFAIIGEAARIGDDSDIGAYCEIGVQAGVLPPGPLRLGAGALIRSHSVVYQNSTFGPGLKTGHRVTIRESVHAGAGLQVGTQGDVQGHCTIGDHVRFQSNVTIGQRSRIGNYVWIFANVVLTNDPHPPSERLLGCEVDDFAVIATMVTVLPGKRIGRGALVGAMSLVREDVPDDTICVGVPGRNVGSTQRVKFKDTGKPVYPWRRHFHRGYPMEVVQGWLEELRIADDSSGVPVLER